MGRTRRAAASTSTTRRNLLRRCERGAVALLVSAGLGLVGATVVALDVGSIRTARQQLHHNAAGAALAALARLPDADAARTAAFTYAAANDVSGLGTLDAADDIEFGWWDPDTATFYPAGTGVQSAPVSAVRVTAHRQEVETNVGGMVAPVLGMETTDLEATEVASVALATIHFEGLADGPVAATLGAGTGTDIDERDGTIGIRAMSATGVTTAIVDLRCGLGCDGVDAGFDDARHALVSGGGTVTIDFRSFGDGDTTPWSLRLLGVHDEGGSVSIGFRSPEGTLLDTQDAPSPPTGETTTWFLDPVDGVTTLTFEIDGNVAIDDLRLATGLTIAT